MSAKPTPGPWMAMPYRKVNGADGVEVCALQSRKIEVADANAHLIAAAPDMLEALEALDALQDFGDTLTPFTALTFDDVTAINAAFVLARNAIKKARGQS